jgi:hypothetical protein
MQQTNTQFSHTATTLAPPERVWHLWTDVPNWHEWDTGLKTAQLNGPFAAGTSGTLVPLKGLPAHFILTEVIPGQSYTIQTRLPLGSLYVRRVLRVENGQTLFTHNVWFSGPSKHVFGYWLGRGFRAMLPGVLAKIKTLAEQ